MSEIDKPAEALEDFKEAARMAEKLRDYCKGKDLSFIIGLSDNEETITTMATTGGRLSVVSFILLIVQRQLFKAVDGAKDDEVIV